VAEVEYSEVGNKIVAIIKSFSSEQNAAAAQNIAAVAEVALV
jgi:hypothetical protein